jgi:trimeric autotransporter adhesin
MSHSPKIVYRFMVALLAIFLCFENNAQASFSLGSDLCVGDTIKITANTGTLSATNFSWTCSLGSNFSAPNQSVTIISFSTAGSYTIQLMVASGTQTSNAMQVVTVHSLPIVTLTSSEPFLCNNQSATLTAGGALSYVWTPTVGLYFYSNSSAYVSPLTTVAYTIDGTDSLGCKATASHTIEVYNYPTLVVQASSQIVCLGSTTTLTANGASNYTWTSTSLTTSLNQSTIAVGPGTYSLLGSNGGCKDSIAVVIAAAPSLTLEVNKSRNVICKNDGDSLIPITLNASGALLYTWEPYSPAHMSFSLGAVTVVSPTISTCYTLTGSTSECSASEIICVTVATCTSLEKIETDLEVIVYQNPLTEKLLVQLENSERCTLRVYNLSGKLILEKEIVKKENSPVEVVFSHFSPGMYLLDLTSYNKKSKRTKVIKQ